MMSRTSKATRSIYIGLLTVVLVGASVSSAKYGASDRNPVLREAAVQRASYGNPDADTGPAVPPNLVPPAGQMLTADFAASGVQVYRCTTGTWTFVEPAANLLGRATQTGGIQSAIHFRGPSWESTGDGSLVEARVVATSPVPGSIPQLLLQATMNRGDGIFGHVTYIQRLGTSGGAAPTGACTDGQTSGVPYQAEYRFYEPVTG
jgi:hypothetical protein